jgi:hypothetical protein
VDDVSQCRGRQSTHRSGPGRLHRLTQVEHAAGNLDALGSGYESDKIEDRVSETIVLVGLMPCPVQPARREETLDLVELRSRNCWLGLFCRTGNRDPGTGGSAKAATDYLGCARH